MISLNIKTENIFEKNLTTFNNQFKFKNIEHSTNNQNKIVNWKTIIRNILKTRENVSCRPFQFLDKFQLTLNHGISVTFCETAQLLTLVEQ